MHLKITIKNRDLYEQIMACIFLISICLGGYFIPNTNLSLGLVSSFLISILIFLYYIIIKKQVFFLNKWIFIFACYIITSQFALSAISGELVVLKRLITLIISTFIVFVYGNLINEKNFLKTYVVIGIICSIGLLYQSILVYLYKQPVSPIVIIPRIFVPKTNWAINILRPMSFFQEPQAYAGFMIPVLIYTLFDRKYSISFLFIISIFLSTSTTGIILAIAISIYVMVIINKYKMSSYLFMIILIIVFLLSINSNLFSYTINKIINISFNNERLSNGFKILKSLDINRLFFGIGAGNIINEELINLPKYFSTFSGIIIEYGFLGLLLYCFMIYKLYIGQNKISKLFVTVIFTLSFTQTILFNTAFVNYYTSYIICSVMNDKDNFMLIFKGNIGRRE